MQTSSNNSFLSSLPFTYISQFIKIVSQVLLIKLLVVYLSESDFGAYMVIKRYINAIWPVLTLHLGLSLSRNIGANRSNRTNYLFSSVIIISTLFIIYLFIMFLFRRPFAQLLFGSIKYYYLIFPLSLYVYSNSFKSIMSGYFRGSHNFIGMNLTKMMFWVLQVIILLILNLYINDSNKLLTSFLLIFSVISFIIYFYFIVLKVPDYYRQICKFGFWDTLKSNYELIKYGAARIPNVFMIAAIYFIPVFYASNMLSLKQAGYIGGVITYIRLFQVTAEPLNQLMLPVFSFNKSNKGMALVRKHSKLLLEFLFTFPAILGMIAYLISDEIIILWFGNNFSAIIGDVSMISPLIVFLLSFILIRGVLNGLFSFPYLNFISLYGLLGILAGILFVHLLTLNVIGLSLSFGLAIFILGASSIYYLSKTLSLSVFSGNNIKSILWAIFVFIIFFIFKRIINFDNIYFMILCKMFLALIIFILSFIFYIKMDYKLYIKLLRRYNLNKIIEFMKRK